MSWLIILGKRKKKKNKEQKPVELRGPVPVTDRVIPPIIINEKEDIIEKSKDIPKKSWRIIAPDKRKAIDDFIKSAEEYTKSSTRDFEFSSIISSGGFPPHIKP